MSKTGLALSSGAAKGLAHIGVLKALTEKGVSIDMIAGSSMGALVGACYAREAEITALEELILKTDWKQLLRLADPNVALMFKGFIHGQKVKELLRTIIGDIKFKDLKIPLAVVTTDVNTGEEVIIKEGSVIEAVRASISIPAIFMPVKFKNRFLIDGGIINPVPIKVVKDMGATFVIACNAIPESKKRRGLNSIKKRRSTKAVLKAQLKSPALIALNNKINKLILSNKSEIKNFQKFAKLLKMRFYKGMQIVDPKTPNIFDTIMQAIYVMEYEITRMKLRDADIVISPELSHIASLEFYRGKEAILEGYKAAKNTVLNIQT